ncbi:exodeoxyribonuclease V subunit alpha [Mergibacter septicus]|uniref:exodeoxyribonuclease V subunit alpha n=1 Tax=Mergibacter septicus TaxID=221402 RepID=UPI001C7883DA|nr:exodeoxyribonuclease V subunit alpha [Mergibacter septicus]QDJ12507.1 exodeoxyribonuclease V subunit alpha [Mergibacter septicus]
MLTLLYQLRNENIISSLDYYFAQFITEQGKACSTATQDLVAFLACLSSYYHQQGYSCLYLNAELWKNPFDLAYRQDKCEILSAIQQKMTEVMPTSLNFQQWQHQLQSHPAFSTAPTTNAPFLLQQYSTQTALYLQRVWQDEHQIATFLAQSKTNSKLNKEQIAIILDKLFPEQDSNPTNEINWQKVAIATAIKQQICLISGGPGTGKTRTVSRLLIGLQWLQLLNHQAPLCIKLVAPTGKAAARLNESISDAIQSMPLADELKNLIPQQASTIHRLLGLSADRLAKYNQNNPLNVDVLVIDEASMIDLSLLATLFRALPASTKVILLGDKDQLASVEAGAILGELGQFLDEGYSLQHAEYLQQVCQQQVNTNHHQTPLRDSLCHLSKSYRFDSQSGIGHLARAINQNNAHQSWQCFTRYADLELINYQNSPAQQVANYAVTQYSRYLEQILAKKNLTQTQIKQIFTLFKQIRFLSALRIGHLGVENLNDLIAEQLRIAKLVYFRQPHEWYSGKAIMVTQNDPNIQLFNGDIGLALPDEDGRLKIWFESENGQFRAISPSRVPANEPAYVMTIHKSQGSEFEHCIMLLPQEFNPILTNELIYTGITRAKKRLTVFADEQIWKTAVYTHTTRQSGLAEQLRMLYATH